MAEQPNTKPKGISLEQACLDIAKFKKEKGCTLSIKPKYILIRPNQAENFKRLLVATQATG